MPEDNSNKLMKAVAEFIVDKRNAFYLIFIVAIIFSVNGMGKVKINDDISSYLPPDTETRRGLDLMEEEFITYDSAQIMVSNITYEKAEEISEYFNGLSGITTVNFDDTEDHYKNAAALYSIIFDGADNDKNSVEAMTKIKEYLADYDVYISSEVGKDTTSNLQKEMGTILVLAALIIVAVLVLTSKSYAEVLVFFIVFSVSAVLNMGTNYFFGEISFITNAIAVVLQLALAIDYAIIFCHRYMEEQEIRNSRDAAIESLSKAIVEISASSLTTISGLLALTLMQYRIGYDMGVVLIKGIIASLLTVFFLMPGLLMMFSGIIDKTKHKSFVPDIKLWGKFIIKLRFILPVVFIFVVASGYYYSSRCDYVFSINAIDTANPSTERIAYDKIRNNFGEKNTIAILVPSGDFHKERKILESLEKLPEINSATGIANTKISPDDSDMEYYLSEEMSPRIFAEMAGIDVEVSTLLFDVYGVSKEEYGAILNKDNYTVPLIDIFMFLCEQKDLGVIDIDDEETSRNIDDAYEMLKMADNQMRGEKYSRLVFTSNLPEESSESFEFIELIRKIVSVQYDPDDFLIVGNTVNAKDLSESFEGDNVKISILTILFVMVILLFTFMSAGLPVLLILTIQGSIWINFSFPYFRGSNMFFIAYLIVSSIQMGATIDYAIVLTNRYLELKNELSKKDAAIEALNQSFSTILTSGSIMTIAGFLIYFITTDPTIGSIGLALGRGTLISIILVMTVLPQLLVIGDTIIEKTAFTMKKDLKQKAHKDFVKMDGHLKGHISGYMDAEVKGFLRGSMDAVVQSKVSEDENEESNQNKN